MAYWLQLEDASREVTDAELATLEAQLAAPPSQLTGVPITGIPRRFVTLGIPTAGS